ncbi:poly-beta-1,6 N-acetyl-D-glucosamine export porin PgaA [Pusillimonas sp. ANT_WB101]|uniref:poly-beta-1,6 N-acetyl-D-glucosamine export porin PgaA n=1 Tax=Pusillimonas sp. ANT_WB101 TaxID=2597356 RepID=UPI0011EC8FC7|nr:poly-beta-1,6 N-acetyl-D-glucosamine export porin PgaA [Pusillimonas sp. ANT_WB101]KAA0911105.1 poly-beta-1,6 N-acetyl-D-glucosamine export porin PgaA [Pusillimonas sp. ANT_WB101]
MGLLSCQSQALTRQEYDAKILQARAGNFKPALEMLRDQQRLNPQNLRAAYDHILIASWAASPSEVITAYEVIKSSPRPLPADVQADVAAAYRDLKQWDAGIAHYREGRKLYPEQARFIVGEIKTLVDAGRSDEALSIGKSLTEQRSDTADIELALAYAYQKQQDVSQALALTTRAHTMAPKKAYVTREYLNSLRAARLYGPALRVAREHPELVSAAELQMLEADEAAELTRFAPLASQDESNRFLVADEAIDKYDKLLGISQGGIPASDAADLRMRTDRLQALHARMRMADVVQEYESMQAEGIEVPSYALGDVADAYLYLRKPEKAVEIYTAQINSKGASTDKQLEADRSIGMYYALLESGHYREASDLLQAAIDAEPDWLLLKGQPIRQPNEKKVDLMKTSALANLYTSDAKLAVTQLEAMVSNAPNNTSLHTALASGYRSQQKPRKAERELKLAETLSPRALEVELGQGSTALDLQEWQQAESLMQDTNTRFPENQQALRLKRDWDVHTKQELRVAGYRGISSGSPVSGNGDMGIDTVLYSAPIHYNWRAFAGAGYAEGKFQEGKAHYRWQRAGAEWRSRGITAEAEASTNDYGYGIKLGLRASATYDLNDHWQLGATGELLSRDTPLRALLANVYSNSLGFSVRWHSDETSEWSANLTPSRFTDGNKRLAATITGRQQLYVSPTFKADLLFELSSSRNSQIEANYFNPRSDLFVMPSLRLSHSLYQRYQDSVVQTFTAGAGAYAQKGYGTAAVVSLGYGLRYRTNDVFDVGAVVNVTSRPYDGIRERDIQIMFDMNLRF